MRGTRLLPGLLPGVRRLVGFADAAADVGGVRRVSGSGPAEGWSAWSERASGWRGRGDRVAFASSAAETSSAAAEETPKHFLVPMPVLSPLMVRRRRFYAALSAGCRVSSYARATDLPQPWPLAASAVRCWREGPRAPPLQRPTTDGGERWLWVVGCGWPDQRQDCQMAREGRRLHQGESAPF